MPDENFLVETPAKGDWPTLRDVVVRTEQGRRCLDLMLAVAESPHPAQAWRDRLADMTGPGRLMLFVRYAGHGMHVEREGAEQVVLGFVSAYLDGAEHERCVIVRHLLTDPCAGTPAADLLLEHVESWAESSGAREVLVEVEDSDLVGTDLLTDRGYRPGITRPAFDALDLGDRDQPTTTEWTRRVGVSQGRRRRLYAVAS